MAAALSPNSIIGIVGSGQLGRMTALAAARLGYRCHIFGPEENSPAAQVSSRETVAAYDDEAALVEFAKSVDVITYEFENIPLPTVKAMDAITSVRPGPKALEVSQHRLVEKTHALNCDVETTEFAGVDDLDGLCNAVADIGTNAILKTSRFGYDGKGQIRITADMDLGDAWQQIGQTESILEKIVPFEKEISVIVARSISGETRSYPPVENVHVNHILDTTTAPADISEQTRDMALSMAERLAASLDLVGLLAVEFFVKADGKVLMNEIAPRPHNSGHWSQDGCATDQFEQLVRAITGLPLGAVDILHPTVMKNLIGDEVNEWPELIKEPGANLHLYGKAEIRPGRKMGHVNRIKL